MTHVRRLRLGLPVALLATGGCLATRSDVEKLQLSVTAMQESMRAEQVRSDSTTRALLRAATQQLAQQFDRHFANVSDSVRAVSAGLQRLQGDVQLSMVELRRDMVVVQEGIGISQRRIQDLKATVEAIPVAPATQPAPAPGAAPGGAPGAAPGAAQAGTAAPPPSGAPPAATLWSLARGQLISGATGSARNGFQTLVNEYPNHERAPDSQMFIAETYAAEGNRPAADSVYAMVVTMYPGTDSAARSIWKRANLAIEVSDKPRAIGLLQQIVDSYPRSDVYENAADLLRTLRQP